MNTETIIAELERINRWRRGDDSIAMPNPSWIGEVIDAAIASLRSLVASNATLRNQRNESERNLEHYVREAADDRRAFEAAQGRVELLDAELASAKAELAELRVSYEQNAHQCVELHRELARVKAEWDEAKAELFSDQATIAETVSKYEAELAALRRDKERLDWLENREPDAATWDYVADAINIRAAIDAAIDAAMKEVRRG